MRELGRGSSLLYMVKAFSNWPHNLTVKPLTTSHLHCDQYLLIKCDHFHILAKQEKISNPYPSSLQQPGLELLTRVIEGEFFTSDMVDGWATFQMQEQVIVKIDPSDILFGFKEHFYWNYEAAITTFWYFVRRILFHYRKNIIIFLKCWFIIFM